MSEVPCPACMRPLKREDVKALEPEGSGSILWRLYSTQKVRCANHLEPGLHIPKALGEASVALQDLCHTSTSQFPAPRMLRSMVERACGSVLSWSTRSTCISVWMEQLPLSRLA